MKTVIPAKATDGVLRSLSDEEAMQKFLEGDARAFDELVRRYQKPLLHFVYQKIGDREKAEDVVQDTFVRVYRHRKRFDQSKKFSTWIYIITERLVKNELRLRSRHPTVLISELRDESTERPWDWEDKAPRPDEVYRRRYLRQLVEEAIQELPQPSRQIFILRELRDKTYEEIGEIMGIAVGTVKSQLYRARVRFTKIILRRLN